ncbi:hypothetical protein M3Y95_00021800 [Aphelenchoides besseyi]|nr:hypothetical protein M3Y95_00021800 [Aphelenchoides besseyi]
MTQECCLQITFCRAMATKKCARSECGKTVYPLEELNCLDKTWHKGCFRCTTCGMALNMKNYKGYEKNPYCEPHYPKVVATVVTETPEMKRVAENTRLQSQHKYHEEYEKLKGKKTDVIDDPELLRHKQNSKVQSNVQYHGELERKERQERVRPKEDPNAVPSSIPMNEDEFAIAQTVDVNPIACKLTDVCAVTERTQQTLLSNTTFDYAANKENFATTVWSSTKWSANNGNEPVKVGSIADFDPVNGEHGSIGGTQKTETPVAAAPAEVKTGTKKTKKTKSTGFTVKANYDYTAADSDEISFKENDIIVNCQAVDEGWMTGTLQRTLEHGMLPANYVEKIVEKTGQFKLS